MQYSVIDIPGDATDSFDFDAFCRGPGAVVFVIDAQDDYIDALARLIYTARRAFTANHEVLFEVFIHKVDALSDDYRLDTQREIQQRVGDELADAGLEDVNVSFHLTSIYDHSVFEAFSKVIQRLVTELPTLENLLNMLCQNSGIEKAFLFDVASKVYIATDSSPTDTQSYEICSDMIDVVLDVSEIYQNVRNKAHQRFTSVSSKNSSNDQEPVAKANDLSSRSGSSMIKLANGMVLYLREVNQYLVLICLLRSENFEKHGLIDYNIQCFREAVQDVFELKQRRGSRRVS